MDRKKERIVIQGNEFYEIDLECEKRKKEGKPCKEEENRRNSNEKLKKKN